MSLKKQSGAMKWGFCAEVLQRFGVWFGEISGDFVLVVNRNASLSQWQALFAIECLQDLGFD